MKLDSPFARSEKGNVAIPGSSCCSRKVDIVGTIEILLSHQERLLFKTSEQRFQETQVTKTLLKLIERKTGLQEHVLKIKDVCFNSRENGHTCRCFRDKVI